MSLKYIRFIANTAIILALFVVMLGAYTRLTDAGLGCPDWPLCYGHMVVNSEANALDGVHNKYKGMTIEPRKAWTEMAHRYAAFTLSLLIISIFISSWRVKVKNRRLPRVVPTLLILLLAFQAALGMWTVTLKLLPVVVMGHLLGGMLIFASLCYFRMQLSQDFRQSSVKWQFWVNLGLVLIFLQIALGGWVSSNYAGIACIGFPQCNGQWLPSLDFSNAFNLLSPIGDNYQGGRLAADARLTIQFIHRIGALVVASYVIILSLLIILKEKVKALRLWAIFALLLVLMQFTIGIVNVIYLLPIWSAVMHNGLAALLLATMLMICYLAKWRSY